MFLSWSELKKILLTFNPVFANITQETLIIYCIVVVKWYSIYPSIYLNNSLFTLGLWTMPLKYKAFNNDKLHLNAIVLGWYTRVKSVMLSTIIKNDGKMKWSVNLIFWEHCALQEKNEKATWLELTCDFGGTVTLQSKQHVCKKETIILLGEQFMRKERTTFTIWNHVEAPCSLPQGYDSVSKNNQLLIQ